MAERSCSNKKLNKTSSFHQESETTSVMFQTGLLILTIPLRALISHSNYYLSSAKQFVKKRLYIKLEPDHHELFPAKHSHNADANLLDHVIPNIYCQASVSCSHLDVRILQGFSKGTDYCDKLSNSNFEVVLTNSEKSVNNIQEYLNQQFSNACNNVHVIPPNTDIEKEVTELSYPTASEPLKQYKKVILGGTFDRLHNGHKMFLSLAALRTTEELTIGITDDQMLHRKKLWELIEPLPTRISVLKEFLNCIDPTITYQIVPIYDAYGPATEIPDLECIVVSEETYNGGLKVNVERERKKMKALDIYKVPILEDCKRIIEIEEIKLSSSSYRLRDLGKEITPPVLRPHLPNRPYLVGLTGGIASGKSSISQRLKQLGAAVIDCDKLGHKTYEPGSNIYKSLVEKFGQTILNADKTINRKSLGAKVFDDESLRQYLNSLVWPEVDCQLRKEINKFTKAGAKVIVLEAALLLEANWQEKVHQVWVCIIPESEALSRIIQRDSLTTEQALSRIHSQMTNVNRVKHANVVFSTLWDVNFTQLQVEQAWNSLQKYLPVTKTNKNSDDVLV